MTEFKTLMMIIRKKLVLFFPKKVTLVEFKIDSSDY